MITKRRNLRKKSLWALPVPSGLVSSVVVYPFKIHSVNLRKPRECDSLYGLLERDEKFSYFWPYGKSLRDLVEESVFVLKSLAYDSSTYNLEGSNDELFPNWRIFGKKIYHIGPLTPKERRKVGFGILEHLSDYSYNLEVDDHPIQIIPDPKKL